MRPAKQFAMTHVVIFLLCACNAVDHLVCALRAFFIRRGDPHKARMTFYTAVCSEEKVVLAFFLLWRRPALKIEMQERRDQNDGRTQAAILRGHAQVSKAVFGRRRHSKPYTVVRTEAGGFCSFFASIRCGTRSELAIVFRVEERREIDRITVDETRAAILELGRRACTDDTVYENFETALRAATADYARIPNEYRLDTIRQYGGIKCAPGQKASRIINRLCLKFHLDQIEEETEAGEPDNRYVRIVKPFNALFARLADALNPAHIEKTAVLSIHPCDFLEMSNRDNTWSSCHCLDGGGYRGGCQSYMGDAVSMIFFTVSDEYTQNFHTAPRITREIFCYKDNVLLQSRLYPTDLEDQKTLYRGIVQQAIAVCLDKPNLWSIKRGKETEPYCESAADSNHYPDYKYGYAVASLLKGEIGYGKMTIGSVARCVCCGGEQKNHRSIRCAECGNMYVCKVAAKRCMDMDAILIITSIAMSAAMNVRFARKCLSVCRASALPAPASSAGFAPPAMSRLLACAETVQSIATAFPSVPIVSARTR